MLAVLAHLSEEKVLVSEGVGSASPLRSKLLAVTAPRSLFRVDSKEKESTTCEDNMIVYVDKLNASTSIHNVDFPPRVP